MPANAAGFFVERGLDPMSGEEAADLRLSRDDGRPIAFEMREGAARFLEPLEAGDAFTAELGRPECQRADGEPIVRRGVVGPEAPLPDRLGSLQATDRLQGTIQVPVGCGLCTDEIEAVEWSIELAYAEAVQPWRSMLRYDSLAGPSLKVAAYCSEVTASGCRQLGNLGRVEALARSVARLPTPEGTGFLATETLSVVADCRGSEFEMPAPGPDDPQGPGDPDGFAATDGGCRENSSSGASLLVLAAAAAWMRRRKASAGALN